MAITRKDLYYSKVMLFGEYSIIMGSMGLTIPFSHFNGQLAFVNENSYTDLEFAQNSNRHLLDFCGFVEQQQKTEGYILDTNRFRDDLQTGMFFESSIPESYGLGSSGALVASVYGKYAKKRIEADPFMSQDKLATLKKSFAKLESYFHGTSSGIDPLICYLNHPLCIENGQTISAVNLPLRKIDTKDAIFLLNTGAPGKTAPLVQQFMQRMNDEAFSSIFGQTYIPLVNQCISKLIEGNTQDFYVLLKQLSAWQAEYFRPMISENVLELWQSGLESELYTLKLCGSGGGGFVLGFTHDYEKTRHYFKSLQKEIVPVYQVTTGNLA